ncbi:hypothetical protein [uncultured Mediterranean phage uvDeep-CGR2-KM18-C74]|nr:hypothetical protein [uncultured Mediterranean phage uvDeep-CGR2-KM18-C74]
MHGDHSGVGRGGIFGGGSLEADIARWMHVGGGTDKEGRPITKPLDLEQAELVDGICQRYGVLPSALLNENVGLLKMLHIVSLGTKDNDG